MDIILAIKIIVTDRNDTMINLLLSFKINYYNCTILFYALEQKYYSIIKNISNVCITDLFYTMYHKISESTNLEFIKMIKLAVYAPSFCMLIEKSIIINNFISFVGEYDVCRFILESILCNNLYTFNK